MALEMRDSTAEEMAIVSGLKRAIAKSHGGRIYRLGELRAEELRQRGKETRRAHLEAKMREHEEALAELDEECPWQSLGALEETDEDFLTPDDVSECPGHSPGSLDDCADYDETARSARRNHCRELDRPDPLDLDDARTHAEFDSLAMEL